MAIKGKPIVFIKQMAFQRQTRVYFLMNVSDGTDQRIETAKMTEFCPIYASLFDLLSRRWMGIVLRVLMSGPHRFSEILAVVPGLSDPLLTQRLRELQAKKIVDRRVYPSSPVRVEYELTDAGRDLETALRALSAWADKWMTPTGETQAG
jgi:DNA-binding HxlR family transcriptional regulator